MLRVALCSLAITAGLGCRSREPPEPAGAPSSPATASVLVVGVPSVSAPTAPPSAPGSGSAASCQELCARSVTCSEELGAALAVIPADRAALEATKTRHAEAVARCAGRCEKERPAAGTPADARIRACLAKPCKELRACLEDAVDAGR